MEGYRTSQMYTLSIVKILGMLWSQWPVMLVSLDFHLLLPHWLNNDYCDLLLIAESLSNSRKNSYANLLVSRLKDILT